MLRSTTMMQASNHVHSHIRYGRPELVEDPAIARKFIVDSKHSYKTILYRSDPPTAEPRLLAHYERTKYEEDAIAYDEDTKTRLVPATFAAEDENKLAQILGPFTFFHPAELRFLKEMNQKPLFTIYGPQGTTILITEGEHATAHIDDYDTTATIIQIRDLDILVRIDDVDDKGMPIRNHDNPLTSIQKEHAKYMIGPDAPNCISEMAAMAVEAVQKRKIEKQAMANGQDRLQNFTMSTRNNAPGDDGSRDESSGVASASTANEIARRNVKNNNKTNKRKGKTAKKAKKTVKPGLKNPPTTRLQTRATSTPTTITTNHRNEHSGAVSDESTDLVSHAEFTMDDLIIPKLQAALIDACYSVRITRKQLMKTMKALSDKNLPDNYDSVDDSYPGKGNK